MNVLEKIYQQYKSEGKTYERITFRTLILCFSYLNNIHSYT